MKWVVLVLFLISCATPSFCRIRPTDSKAAAAEVLNVINRLIGSSRTYFNITVDESLSLNGKDTFTLHKSFTSGVVNVVGSSGVAAAWGFNYYIKKYCNCHISWDGDQLGLPEEFPAVNETVASLDIYKYYQNVCTSSYSFVWWDWPRWEREIDWMALNGVNLALAFGAQEAIWRRVYDGLGVVYDNFTGPAFLAWDRMGNIRGFGGGLTANWHKRSVDLQHRVLDRMRALGITPVLPAFNGILPPDFQRVFPQAKGTNISRWNNFPDQYSSPFLLSPSDPLFVVVSRVFLREYIAEFGTDHIYNADTFNENTPDTNDPTYLADTARAIYQGIFEADPAAVWMVQGWAFLDPFWGKEQVKAFVTSIPIGKMLLLDLQSDLTPLYDQFESYYGQPFIWCTLHNFGGQLGMYGHLEKVNNGIVHGRTFANSSMVGIGITPEGIDQNFVMYDLTLDGSTQNGVRNLTEWLSDYIRRRYGVIDSKVDEAWQILRQTVYDYDLEKSTSKRRKPIGKATYGDHIAKNILTKLPTLRMTEITWYEKKKVYNAFQMMLSAAATNPSLATSPLFLHDLVDTTRQTVQLATGILYQRLINLYKAGDRTAFNETSGTFLNLLDDLDTVLSTNKKFLLGPWLEGAKEAASSTEEKILYEVNARNQITLWGPTGEIRDYAAKQWSGMISDFYKPRWKVFFDALQTSLDGGPKYNRTEVNRLILESIEIPFTLDTKQYSVEPNGSSLEVVRAFNNSWGVLDDIFDEELSQTNRPTVVTSATSSR